MPCLCLHVKKKKVKFEGIYPCCTSLLCTSTRHLRRNWNPMRKPTFPWLAKSSCTYRIHTFYGSKPTNRWLLRVCKIICLLICITHHAKLSYHYLPSEVDDFQWQWFLCFILYNYNIVESTCSSNLYNLSLTLISRSSWTFLETWFRLHILIWYL